MLGYVGWIFSMWFFLLSVGFMVAAIMLVATHFETFRSKLPSYHEFFSFKTAIYLWIALGVVKVIHEFGHGLSCKRFGGEVHEMGALLMCLSPALYCNVSDAWILPNKWHRIIISAAGIYVELVIAAIATFVWWYTPTQPFINNLSLSLMVVCSVSTVVFNANPLMRYDGYYVLADWLEIPNLREKSNRYLKNIVLDKCLGIEVPPEEYMELWRKILFVSYAIVSYIYRWVVTFSIIFIFGSFLKPYKLEIIAHMMKIAAVASMTIWPAYNLFKSIHRRGRLPDMKRPRVLITTSVLVVVLLFVCFVPVPISRIRGLALVQAHPVHSSQIVLSRSALLERLYVRAGDKVTTGMLLASFSDPDLEEKISQALAERENARQYLRDLARLYNETRTDKTEQQRISAEMVDARGKEEAAEQRVKDLLVIKNEELTLRAKRDGVVGQAPRIDDIGRLFEGSSEQPGAPPIFTIHEEGMVRLCLPLETADYNRLQRDLTELEARNKANGTDKELWINLRVHGLESQTWRGSIERLDESEAKYIPMLLSTRGGGPVAVHPPNPRAQGLTPQAQHYLVYITIRDPDAAIAVGAMSQVKIYLQPETCLHWFWRTINDMLHLRLI
jgi:putative peptide zinc metalloprotease protein